MFLFIINQMDFMKKNVNFNLFIHFYIGILIDGLCYQKILINENYEL
jgi:hypothetical protein